MVEIFFNCFNETQFSEKAFHAVVFGTHFLILFACNAIVCCPHFDKNFSSSFQFTGNQAHCQVLRFGGERFLFIYIYKKKKIPVTTKFRGAQKLRGEQTPTPLSGYGLM